MKALVFDFETTGLTLHPNAKPHLQPRAIEYAGVLIDAAGVEHGELNFLCQPGQEISAEITKITGITNEDLATATPFANWLPRLRGQFIRADILIAHNLPFDHAILAHELALAGASEGWPWPRINLCTAQTYEPLWGRRPRLIDLHEAVLGEKYDQTHRALDDVRALAKIVVQEKLLDLIASAPSAHGVYLPTGFFSSQQGSSALR